MRTSVDIPDDLLRKAKVHAAEHGKTLRQLIVDGLESQVLPESDTPRWLPIFGMLADHKDEIRRMQKEIDEEFSKIDEESWK